LKAAVELAAKQPEYQLGLRIVDPAGQSFGSLMTTTAHEISICTLPAGTTISEDKLRIKITGPQAERLLAPYRNPGSVPVPTLPVCAF
jgi:hypothetical protein